MGDSLRIALLISGGGSTAEAIIHACRSGRLARVSPALVIASRPDAKGVERVKAAGMDSRDVVVVSPRCSSPGQFADAIISHCESRGVDFLGQYGWMVKTPVEVIRQYEDMMVNQHPGPLDPGPSVLGVESQGRLDFGGKGMYGLRVHAAVLWFARHVNRQFWTEAVAQRVAFKYDQGAVLKRKGVLIYEKDDPISLQQRVLPIEYEVQIQTLEDFAEGRVRELVRGSPLILPGEEGILQNARWVARILFPRG